MREEGGWWREERIDEWWRKIEGSNGVETLTPTTPLMEALCGCFSGGAEIFY